MSEYYDTWTSGMSPEDAVRFVSRKRNMERLGTFRRMWKARVWRENYEEKKCRVVTGAANALEGMGRRFEALYLLENKKFVDISDSEWEEEEEVEDFDSTDEFEMKLAFSKLLFKDGKYDRSVNLLEDLIASFESSVPDKRSVKLIAMASDAFYFAGWVCVHSDNHTRAYDFWSRGANVMMGGEALLNRQATKRKLWDEGAGVLEGWKVELGMGGGVREVETVGYADVVDGGAFVSPARRIFDSSQGEIVHTTIMPVCPIDVCQRVVETTQRYVDEVNKGVWGSVRAATVKTTDVAIEDVPVLRGWMRELCEKSLFPIVHRCYPRLADGSLTYKINEDTGQVVSRLRLHDAFIVRYDECDGSLSLPEHVDTSVVSMTIALNDKCEYDGGGTWFQHLEEEGGGTNRGRVLNNDIGNATIFAGPMRHAGYPITKGTRWIAVLFCYVEGYAYGNYLRGEEEEEVKEEKGEKGMKGGVRPSGDKDGGYVVYRQTVELANLLDRNDYDEVDEEEEERN